MAIQGDEGSKVFTTSNSEHGNITSPQKTIMAYTKPSKSHAFSKSAAKRTSVMALGSISHLQHFYAKTHLTNINRGQGVPLWHIAEGDDDADDEAQSFNLNGAQVEFPPKPAMPESPTSVPPPFPEVKSGIGDPERALEEVQCAISDFLLAWKLVEGEAQDSDSKDINGDAEDENPLQVNVLSMIETTARAVQAVRNYTLVKHDVNDTQLSLLRTAALDVLEAISRLESTHRRLSTSLREDGSSQESSLMLIGHEYRRAEYSNVHKERRVVIRYLDVVEECLFGVRRQDGKQIIVESPDAISQRRTLEVWALHEPSFERNLEFLNSHLPHGVSIPRDEENALKALSNGRELCEIYNRVVRRSRRPWGFITHIHVDTMLPYRAMENLRFFGAACKIRFDLRLNNWDVTEIVKGTSRSLEIIRNGIDQFCSVAINELLSTGAAFTKSPPKLIRSGSGRRVSDLSDLTEESTNFN